MAEAELRDGGPRGGLLRTDQVPPVRWARVARTTWRPPGRPAGTVSLRGGFLALLPSQQPAKFEFARADIVVGIGLWVVRVTNVDRRWPTRPTFFLTRRPAEVCSRPRTGTFCESLPACASALLYSAVSVCPLPALGQTWLASTSAEHLCGDNCSNLLLLCSALQGLAPGRSETRSWPCRTPAEAWPRKPSVPLFFSLLLASSAVGLRVGTGVLPLRQGPAASCHGAPSC